MPEPKRPRGVCRDCWGEFVLAVPSRILEVYRHKFRPAPHPGPRCVTHHRAVTKARKGAAHDAYVGKMYNLPPGVYKRLYEAQGGLCATCRRATGKAKRLAVDHDHACCPGPISCGKCVRGLLCGVCNKDIIGGSRDSIEFFQRCIDYLTNPPARGVLDGTAPGDGREAAGMP